MATGGASNVYVENGQVRCVSPRVDNELLLLLSARRHELGAVANFLFVPWGISVCALMAQLNSR